jgi:hypothetical protein
LLREEPKEFKSEYEEVLIAGVNFEVMKGL